MPYIIEDAPQAKRGKYVIEDVGNSSAPKKPFDTQLTWGEKLAQMLPEDLQHGLSGAFGGNMRGSVVGGLMQGAAEPGVAMAQAAANIASPALAGSDNKTFAQGVNQSIADTEKQYQSARADAGRSGFDAARLLGNVAITAPAAVAGGAVAGANVARQGAVQGAAFGLAEPVTNGGDNYFIDKAKQAGIGSVGGAVTAKIAGALSKVVSPNINPEVSALQAEGVQPTVGQILGGGFSRAEEKLQSVPLLGDAITAARKRAESQFQDAAFNRALGPIGETASGKGRDAISDTAAKLGASYEEVIPKMSVDVLDPAFVNRLATLRAGVQNLPDREANAFDAAITREIDQRVAPNGMLSGQNLKEAWNALRDKGNQFSKSTDAYQQDLGQAYKQAFQELKDHVTNTNPADVVAQLKNTDLGYANFKRLQSASASLGAEGGNFSPAQLQNAVKAGDFSKDKGRFATGDALMQDLSEAGKNVLSTKYPDSGTTGRALMGIGALGTAAIHPVIPAALIGGSTMYTPMVQNALAALLTKRPDYAPAVANYLRKFAPALTAATVPGTLQQRY